MPKRPLIGYTTRNFAYDPLQWLIGFSIWLGGGKPVRLYPKNPHFDQPIRAIIIGGGTDLYPTLYKLDPKPNYKYDRARDELEIEWLKRAEIQNLPILGICRGAQLLNVQRGGTLHADISKVYENAKYPANFLANIFFRKDVNINPNSLLEKILKTRRIAVNSMHKQSIHDIGKGLVVSAREDNGVIQAVEDPEKKFFIGVQFHPEALIYMGVFRNLFKSLINAARKDYQK